jgi:perosamine synthetase
MFDEFIKFVRQLYQTDDLIPLHAPKFLGNEKKYLLETIDSTFVSSVGQNVADFEQKIACTTTANYAISTVNGTAALHVALIVTGVSHGEEVITQALTFVATLYLLMLIERHLVCHRKHSQITLRSMLK